MICCTEPGLTRHVTYKMGNKIQKKNLTVDNYRWQWLTRDRSNLRSETRQQNSDRINIWLQVPQWAWTRTYWLADRYGPHPLLQCRFRAAQFCASMSAAVAASRADMGSKAFPPPKLLLPTFTPPCLASSTLNTGISVGVCVEGEKVCHHDSSVQNYCLLRQRRRHDNKLDWHDPA
jgi:hypothetical protein